MTGHPGEPPSELAPTAEIVGYCEASEQYLATLQIGFPPDIATRLNIAALADCLGIDPEHFAARMSVHRLRLNVNALAEAPGIAARARLLGGGANIPNNGQGPKP